MSKPLIHVFPNGRVEYGTGQPGYRWSPAYSQVSAGGVSQPLRRLDWYDIARRDGFRVVFHPDKESARRALLG